MLHVADKIRLDTEDRIDHGPADAVEHPDLKTLLRLWNERRGGDPWPRCDAISPRDMKAFLRRIHLYEVVDGGRDFRIRLMGTALTNMRGFDSTGRLLSEHPEPKLGARVGRICQLVLTQAKPIRVTVAHPVLAANVQHLKVEALWLPLGGATIERVLAQSIMEMTPF